LKVIYPKSGTMGDNPYKYCNVQWEIIHTLSCDNIFFVHVYILTISSEQFEIDSKFQTTLHFERKYTCRLKQKINIWKIRILGSSNMCHETPWMQDFAPFTLQLQGPYATQDTWPKLFSLASLCILHLLFQNSLLLLKVLKALYICI
jgi:hypothetical protein